MRIIAVVGEGGGGVVRKLERVQFSSLAIALSADCFAPHPISPPPVSLNNLCAASSEASVGEGGGVSESESRES